MEANKLQYYGVNTRVLFEFPTPLQCSKHDKKREGNICMGPTMVSVRQSLQPISFPSLWDGDWVFLENYFFNRDKHLPVNKTCAIMCSISFVKSSEKQNVFPSLKCKIHFWKSRPALLYFNIWGIYKQISGLIWLLMWTFSLLLLCFLGLNVLQVSLWGEC